MMALGSRPAGWMICMDTFGVYGHALTGEDTETAQAVNGMFLKLLHAGK